MRLVVISEARGSATSRAGMGPGTVLEMSLLNPTPPERLVDAAGRPYFLWDVDMTLATFRERLSDSDPEVRGYFLGKLMRQAKPDDVLTMVSLADIAAEWPTLERYLGDARPFWEWIVGWWRSGHGSR